MLKILRNWPLPAVCVWVLAWAVFKLLGAVGAPPLLALGAACALGVVGSLLGQSWWRRLLIGLGFPLSLLLSMQTSMQTKGVLLFPTPIPAWAWLLLALLLLLIYPVNAWRDAPLFPTPAETLSALSDHAVLPEGALILDAGCGLGHGLQALRQAYPAAQLHGLEYSWALRALCALRCPWARVRHGDMWRTDWSRYAMVYVFQRPESMQRAATKAAAELAAGAWLVSLEFEASTLQAKASYRSPSGKMVWLYQVPFSQAPLR